MHNRILMFSLYSLTLNAFFKPINSSISILFGYITILCAFLYPFLRFGLSKQLLIDKKMLWIIGILCISMLTSADDLSFEKFDNKIIALLSFIVFYWSLSTNQKDSRLLCIQVVCKANYALCAVLLLFGYGPFSFKYTPYGPSGVKVFTLGLGNPNAVSAYVMFAIILLLAHIVCQKKLAVRVFDTIIVGLLFNLLLRLSSRTIVACVLLLLIGYLVGRKKNKMHMFWGIALAFPFAMIAITFILAESNLSIRVLGKALATGRAGMFLSTISDIKSAPFSFVFGQFFKYYFGNMHNGPLSIICTLGLVGLIIYLLIWYKKLKYLSDNCCTTIQRIAFYAMLAFLIQSSSEALFMVGTVPYSIMVIVVDKIAKGEIVADKTEQNGMIAK